MRGIIIDRPCAKTEVPTDKVSSDWVDAPANRASQRSDHATCESAAGIAAAVAPSALDVVIAVPRCCAGTLSRFGAATHGNAGVRTRASAARAALIAAIGIDPLHSGIWAMLGIAMLGSGIT